MVDLRDLPEFLLELTFYLFQFWGEVLDLDIPLKILSKINRLMIEVKRPLHLELEV